MTMTDEELARFERIRAHGPNHYVWTDHDVFTLLDEVKRLRASLRSPARLDLSAASSLAGLAASAKRVTSATTSQAPFTPAPTIIGVAWDTSGNYSAIEKTQDGTPLRQEACASKEAAEQLATEWMRVAWR